MKLTKLCQENSRLSNIFRKHSSFDVFNTSYIIIQIFSNFKAVCAPLMGFLFSEYKKASLPLTDVMPPNLLFKRQNIIGLYYAIIDRCLKGPEF